MPFRSLKYQIEQIPRRVPFEDKEIMDSDSGFLKPNVYKVLDAVVTQQLAFSTQSSHQMIWLRGHYIQ